MASKLKKILIFTFIIAVIAFMFFDNYNSPQQRLKRQIIKDLPCSINGIKIQNKDFAFLVEVCGKTFVYVECACCDGEWFEPCEPSSEKFRIDLCSSEGRYCFDKCMEARKLVGLPDHLSSDILCKEIDEQIQSQLSVNNE